MLERKKSTIIIRRKGAVHVLECQGRIGNGRAIRNAVEDLTKRQQRNIIVDLAKADYMRDEPLAALLESYKLTTKAGGRFALVRPAGKVLEFLQVTKMDTVLGVYPDEAAALSSFQR